MRFVHFIELILVVSILAAVGIPLFRGLSKIKLFSKPDKLGEEFKHLLMRKEEVLLSIKDLEFDLKTDKISQSDYEDLRSKLELEAAGILERLDELEKQKKKGGKGLRQASVL